MANENEDIKNNAANSSEGPKHQSWLGHIVEEAKEKMDELVEEAQNDGGEFSAIGNGHINHVHDHHQHPTEQQPAEKQEEKKAEHHQSWLGHIVDEVKEKMSEMVEEAENDGGEFSALGNGHINHVHDHHHDGEKKEEKKTEE